VLRIDVQIDMYNALDGVSQVWQLCILCLHSTDTCRP
jgi:hypothetical protein